MKDSRKIVLMVLVPMVLLISLGLYGNIGKVVTITDVVPWVTRALTVEDMIPSFIIVLVFAFLIFWIAGLEMKKDGKKA